MGSKIEWTDETWNPVVGCRWASPGCDHCYAVTMTRRLEAMGQEKYAGLTNAKHFNGIVRTVPEELEKPLRWKKPRMVFVNSMSDLFHPRVPASFLNRVFGVMERAGQHTFQVLTKRPENAAKYLGWRWGEREDGPGCRIPARNIWIGTSVENQEWADKRREHFRDVPAAVRFVSYEPALGPVDWSGWEFADQIISGGESGTGARPSNPRWHRATRDFCQLNRIAFFFKQWGEWIPVEVRPGYDVRQFAERSVAKPWRILEGDQLVQRTGKKRSGRKLDGREWNEFPEQPSAVSHQRSEAESRTLTAESSTRKESRC